MLQCPHLKKIRFHEFAVHAEEIDLFFRTCSQLEVLELNHVQIPRWPNGSLIGDLDTNIEATGGPSIHGTAASLVSATVLGSILNLMLIEVWVSGPSPGHSTAALVRSCSKLRSLYFEETEKADALVFFRSLEQHPWTLPHLETLIIPYFPLVDEDLASLLKKMNQLRELDAVFADFGSLSLGELLKSREPLSGRRSLCDTIEKLNLSGYAYNGLSQVIMSRCRNLTELETSKIKVAEIVEGQEWVCSELQQLVINITDVDDGDAEDSEESKVKQRMMFERLGKLTKLREIVLKGSEHGRSFDLRLESGLDKLANLKHLRSLCFTGYYQRMGPEEAMWMVKNWPCLKEVSCQTNRNQVTAMLIRKIFHKHGIG
ncbi:hypothetical protein BCR41DRAFT_348316 [Lobosporangium transversale]|uniref:F-box domain-containing protein n=1 Tax=Lobosporangium transversale TaxID=64571 RepID=A0A1Y2GVW0_9FUNG|nr:hypothetical protein BCR41DRAFT_348316 [Lobosporangium transversale]ORZ26436.1 hypothetical protein BCR41DRAFT_348316 [Lobosporangium transversale]|eukprot:XP_021884201.1 hypothetical protein BCR41DRAFT_348316 [Lobosporangium transversale]